MSVRQLAFVAGVVAMFVGGVFVLASNQASWLPSMQRRDSSQAADIEPSGRLFGTGFGIAVVVGLLGLGLLIGSAIETSIVALVTGVGGLIALALVSVREERG